MNSSDLADRDSKDEEVSSFCQIGAMHHADLQSYRDLAYTFCSGWIRAKCRLQ